MVGELPARVVAVPPEANRVCHACCIDVPLGLEPVAQLGELFGSRELVQEAELEEALQERELDNLSGIIVAQSFECRDLLFEPLKCVHEI